LLKFSRHLWRPKLSKERIKGEAIQEKIKKEKKGKLEAFIGADLLCWFGRFLLG
jgi:hypothetical protein